MDEHSRMVTFGEVSSQLCLLGGPEYRAYLVPGLQLPALASVLDI